MHTTATCRLPPGALVRLKDPGDWVRIFYEKGLSSQLRRSKALTYRVTGDDTAQMSMLKYTSVGIGSSGDARRA